MSRTLFQIENEGGPAFPTKLEKNSFVGMTLREAFAIAALQGVMGNVSILEFAHKQSEVSGDSPSIEMAKVVWDLADAMLLTRKRKQ